MVRQTNCASEEFQNTRNNNTRGDIHYFLIPGSLNKPKRFKQCSEAGFLMIRISVKLDFAKLSEDIPFP